MNFSFKVILWNRIFYCSFTHFNLATGRQWALAYTDLWLCIQWKHAWVCMCVKTYTCLSPWGGNTHYHDTSLWGVAEYWNLKDVSHRDQNTEQCLYNFCYWYCTGAERNKKPNKHMIESVSQTLFHNRDLSGLSHDYNKDTQRTVFK